MSESPSLVERTDLSPDTLADLKDWCEKRIASKPHMTIRGKPDAVVDCAWLIAIVDEIARLRSEPAATRIAALEAALGEARHIIKAAAEGGSVQIASGQILSRIDAALSGPASPAPDQPEKGG